jgi:hypothetical protein
MSTRFPDDLLLPPADVRAEARLRPAKLAAFVPIVVALVGVAAILLGGLTVRGTAGTDPVITGSVQPTPQQDMRHVLEMLDR